jgi:CubicO group peptidase (beta-lactamase class C family)
MHIMSVGVFCVAAVLLTAGCTETSTPPLVEAESKAEESEWAEKVVIQPSGETPALPSAEPPEISYRCGFFSRCDLAEYIANSNLCALFVMHSGRIVFQTTRPEATKCKDKVSRNRYSMASLAKSITSLLFGIVTENGRKLSVETPAADALAGAGVDYPDKAVMIRHLLHMSSGMAWNEKTEPNTVIRIEKPNGSPVGHYKTLVEAVNARLKGASFDPDRPYHYSGFDTQVLGIIVEQHLAAEGWQSPTLATAVQRYFWTGLKMGTKADWNADFAKHPAAPCCMYTAPWDLAKLGNWVLEKYRSGKDPTADWIRRSVADNVDSGEECSFYDSSIRFNYGYQWRVLPEPEDGFTGLGNGGQYWHLFPVQNVVVVQFGSIEPDLCETMLVHRLVADAVSKP